MNKETFRHKIETDQRWLERAILAIDARQLWQPGDVVGPYLAGWIRKRLAARKDLGKTLTGKYVDRGREVIGTYLGELLMIAYEKAEADVVLYSAALERAEERVRLLRGELE